MLIKLCIKLVEEDTRARKQHIVCMIHWNARKNWKGLHTYIGIVGSIPANSNVFSITAIHFPTYIGARVGEACDTYTLEPILRSRVTTPAL
jgi:hypothetical protein